MPLDVGRVTHLLEQMHRSEDDAGDPIDINKVLVTDGARGFTWEDYGAGTGIGECVSVMDYGAVGDGSTDDTAAIQDAIDGVTANGTQSGCIYFPPGEYLVSGSLQDTGAFNGQLLLPNVSTSDPQVVIRFVGSSRPPFAFHGDEPVGASIIRSSLTGASGTAACISGGNTGQNNVQVVIENLICVAPNNPTFTFWNIQTTQGGRRDGLFITTIGLWTLAFTQPSNSNSYGIKLPQTNFSDLSLEDTIMVVNFNTAILHGELVKGEYIVSLCNVGVEIPFMYHPGGYFRLVSTSTPRGVKATGGDCYVDFWYDAEHANVSAGGPINPAWAVIVYDVDDANDYLHGHCRWFGVEAGVGPDHSFTVNGADNLWYEEIGELPAGSPSGPAGGDLSGTYPNPSVVDDSHSHTTATAPGGGPPPGILLESDHATPFAFDEIIQESDGSDFVWESA